MDNFNFRPTRELETLFAFCREITLQKKKRAISVHCYVYGFLYSSQRANELFDEETKEELINIFYAKLLEEENNDLAYWKDDSIPLHVELEDIIKNANYYKTKCNEQQFSSIHVLMSILSYENFTSILFLEKGIAYLNLSQFAGQSIDFLAAIKRPHYVKNMAYNENPNSLIKQLDAYDIIIAKAQIIAIEKKKYAVSNGCFFLALLLTQEIQASIINQSVKNSLIEQLEKLVDKGFVYNELAENIPNYVSLNEIIYHATFLKDKLYENKLSVKHLLLSVLSFDNNVSEIFSRNGIIYEDITNMDQRKKEFLLDFKRPPLIPLDIKIDYSDAQIAAFSAEIKTEQFNTAQSYAEKYLAYEDFEGCDNCCKYMMQLDHEKEISYYIFGKSLCRQKNYTLAIHFLNKIPKTSSIYVRALFLLGHLYSQQKKYELAIEMGLKYLEITPSNPSMLNSVGFFYAEMNNHEKAIPYLEKSIKLDDNPHAYAYDNLGFCYFLKGNFEKAIELIEYSLTLDKGNSFAYKNLALVYQSLGKQDEVFDNLLLAKRYGYTERYDDQVDNMLLQINNHSSTTTAPTKKWFNIFRRKH